MLKVAFLFLMSGGLPVAMAMAGASLLYILFTQSSPPFVVIHRMVSGIDSFPLLAVPFFILAGNLMNNAGVSGPLVLPGEPSRGLPPVRAADHPAGPPRLPLGRPGDVPPGQRGPPTAGALRPFCRPGTGRRAGEA